MRGLAKLLSLSLVVLVSGAAQAKPGKRRPVRRPAATSTSAPSPADDAPMEAAQADEPAQTPAPDAKPVETPPAPKPTPPPEPAKDDAAPSPALSVDLTKLRADYDRLRDELFRTRSRAALVQEGLYDARLGARLEWEAAPDYVIRHAEVRLDGGTIWDSGDKPVTDDKLTIADRPCKAGQHSLTLRLEVRPGTKKKGKDIEGLGYVTEQTFSLVVENGKKTTVVLTADEDGSLPGYEPELALELETEKLAK
ncbi:MAG: hypothetical protein JWM82_2811 [Myxococcales bacterium]|nr:hypothetical protein [Myxococcales bacterium]